MSSDRGPAHTISAASDASRPSPTQSSMQAQYCSGGSALLDLTGYAAYSSSSVGAEAPSTKPQARRSQPYRPHSRSYHRQIGRGNDRVGPRRRPGTRRAERGHQGSLQGDQQRHDASQHRPPQGRTAVRERASQVRQESLSVIQARSGSGEIIRSRISAASASSRPLIVPSLNPASIAHARQ